MKYPSLLQFAAMPDERRNLRPACVRHGVAAFMDPRQLRAVFKRVAAREGVCLDGHARDGLLLLLARALRHCEKHAGRTTYYHQMLGAVLVHPDKREVFALAPEPIVKGDGAKKNDCERNAAKRLLSDVRRDTRI